MSSLRKALGLKPRGHVALESEEIEGQLPEFEGPEDDIQVMIKGPLSDVYTNALDQVYAKESNDQDPAPDKREKATAAGPDDEPEAIESSGDGKVKEGGKGVGDGEANGDAALGDVALAMVEQDKEVAKAVEKIVMESMVNDAAVMSALQGNVSTEQPPSEEYMTLYAVDQTDVEPADVIEVTEMLANSENPENITVLIDSVTPPNDSGEASPEEQAVMAQEQSAAVVALEACVHAFGGKVVRSFPEYLASLKKKK